MKAKLETLFGSRRRLALLRTLFTAEGPLTAVELARRSGVSLPQTGRILRDYVRDAVVVATAAYPKSVYQLYDEAKAVLSPLFAREGLLPEETAKATVAAMIALGAPLMVKLDDTVTPLADSAVLPHAVRLSRQDPALLSTLPVVVINLRKRHPDGAFWNSVRREAVKLDMAQHTGMLLELVAGLVSDPMLLACSRRFKKNQERKSLTAFRGWYKNRWERALAERRTSKVARAWGFLMNTDEADFRHHLDVA